MKVYFFNPDTFFRKKIKKSKLSLMTEDELCFKFESIFNFKDIQENYSNFLKKESKFNY